MNVAYQKYIYLVVLMAAGAIFGVMLVQALTLEQQQQISDELQRYIVWIQSDLTNSHTFLVSFMNQLKWVLLLWLMGISVIGLPVVLLLNFAKGAMLGFSMAMVITEFGNKGVMLSFLSIVPHNLIMIPTILLISGASMTFAHYMIKDRIIRQEGKLRNQLMKFCNITAVVIMLTAVASYVEYNISPLLLKWYTMQ